MAKLYLVRRSMETYIGPMNISQLKLAYRRMEFGLQDEVAASCGEWIAFDDVAALKRRYPELAKVVTEELLGGWGISEHDQKRIIESTKRRYKKRPRSRRKGPRLVFPALVLVVILVAIAAFLMKNSRLSSRFFDKNRLPGPDVVEIHLANGDVGKFDITLKRLLPGLLPRVTTSRKDYEEWIPYLRHFAYRQEGAMVGVSDKMLRGMGEVAAPPDCSVQAWMEYWRKIDLNAFAALNAGQAQYPTAEWSTILFWDPHWIARRKASGWIEPQNYYEACLWMARRAIPQVNKTLPADSQVPPVINLRLDFLINMVKGQRLSNRPEGGILGYVTCLENAPSMILLDKCELPAGNLTDEWKEYLARVKARSETKLFLANRPAIAEDELARLSQLHKIQESRDSFTSFNYQPEIRHIVAIMLNNGSVTEATKRMKYEFPEVQFPE